MTFFSLKDLIPKTAGKFQLQGELKSAMVINRASSLIKDLFDEDICRGIRVKSFKEGILWIAVENSSIAQEVLMKSFHMRNDLNKTFESELIRNIRTHQETAEPEEFFE